MKKSPIAFYIQHYLAPSMTFIYRQLKCAENMFEPIVMCSDRVENLDKFPFGTLYCKKRNYLRIKKSRYYNKLFGSHSLLSINPRISSGQSKYFSNILLKHNTKLIHAHFGPAGLEIVELAKIKKIPLVVTFHGYDASMLLTKKKYVANLNKLFDYAHIVTVSENMKKKLIRIGADFKKISVIKCGIPINKFIFVKRTSIRDKFLNNQEIKFLQISNFVEKKGHEFTIIAFSKFLEHYPNAKLVFAGAGPLRKSMEDLCEKLSLTKYVNFVGLINEDEVRKLFHDADVFLHHSVTSMAGETEGIPTVIMEAMSTGLPVISTYHAGIPELIENEINGYLVNERDVKEYTNILLKLRDCPENLAFNARNKILENFNLELETKKLFRIYESAILNITY